MSYPIKHRFYKTGNLEVRHKAIKLS